MSKRKISGFTLVESLVAMVIGVISVAAMYYSYQFFNKSYQGILDKASISKSSRSGLSQITRELRNVGYKDINFIHTPLEKYLSKDNNVSGFQIGSDSLMFYYDLSPKDRIRMNYKLKKYQNSQDTYLARSYVVQTCIASNNCSYTQSIIDEPFVHNVEDFQVVFKNDKGAEVTPVNFGAGKSNQALVKSIEIYLTIRSKNEIFKKEKNWTIKNADQTYAKFDKYHRESFFVSVYPRNIIKN